MYKQLNKFDVVLSTHGSSLFLGFLEQTAFHRLIIDECPHLLTGQQAACVKSYGMMRVSCGAVGRHRDAAQLLAHRSLLRGPMA